MLMVVAQSRPRSMVGLVRVRCTGCAGGRLEYFDMDMKHLLLFPDNYFDLVIDKARPVHALYPRIIMTSL